MSNWQDRSERNRQRMQRSRKSYVRDLAQQIDELEAHLVQWPVRFDLQEAQEIYRIAHKMKGSAPIFGFERAGKVAGKLCDLWEFALTTGLAPKGVALLEKSQIDLMQLKIELETSVKEIEIDEQAEQAPSLPLRTHGQLLIIDDDDALRGLLLEQFADRGYEIDEAADVETAIRMLRDRSYDVVMLDLMMYPRSGYELFDFLKEDPTLKWVPLVVLSGRDDLDDKVRCLRLGADDYVTKPFQFEELEARVFSLLQRAKQFEQMAFRDALTGIYNRRYFDQQLQLELNWAQRGDRPVSLAFLDIDRFKHVNDTYGHQIGDLVLQGLGHILQQNLRATDFLGRYGGEEFVILLADTDKETAEHVLQRVLDQVRHHPVAQAEGQDFHVTVSVGIAGWELGMPPQMLTQLADEAMYQAKQQGRDRIVISQGTSHLGDAVVVAGPVKRILIADDDPMIRAIVSSRLRALPVELYEAGDGEEAAAMLQGQSVDLCLLDGVMPGIDGFELLAQIKGDPRLREMKVIMLSGRQQEEDVVRGLQLGADDYMSKPFSLVELEIRVKRLLGLE